MHRLVFVVLICTLPLMLKAQPQDWHKGLKSRLDYIIKKSGIDKNDISVSVSYESFDKNVDLYSHNENVLRVPASLSKVFTAGAVLSQLDPQKKFLTHLKSTAEVKGDTLLGDLYLVGTGNPGFISESMWNLVNRFSRTGVKTINGNIVVDDSAFDKVRFDPGREKNRVDRAYDAPIGAMSFNWNSVNIFVRPGDAVGKEAKVYADPQNLYIEVINKTMTAKKGLGSKIKATRIKSNKAGRDIIKVTGRIEQGSEEKVVYKSISQPDYWSGENLKSFLLQRGITVTGQVVLGRAPDSANTLAEDESLPISVHVSNLMKFSNNFVAEMLTKNLSVNAGDSQGSMNSGVRVIKKYIESTGIASGTYSFANPSGLTRSNKFKSKDILKTINHLKGQFQNFPEFLSSLPISGVDGTLEKRMRDASTRGWVRAKTGMLNGVIGLAGFAKSHRGPLFSFVFIFNGSNQKVYKARDLSDRIAHALVNES